MKLKTCCDSQKGEIVGCVIPKALASLHSLFSPTGHPCLAASNQAWARDRADVPELGAFWDSAGGFRSAQGESMRGTPSLRAWLEDDMAGFGGSCPRAEVSLLS